MKNGFDDLKAFAFLYDFDFSLTISVALLPMEIPIDFPSAKDTSFNHLQISLCKIRGKKKVKIPSHYSR